MWVGLLSTWLLAILWVGHSAAVAATDEYQDADPAQSGYLPNHNLHPTVVGSSLFGELWRLRFSANEKFYAKPLVYTPSPVGSRQLVILASTQNKIYSVDAVNGTLIRTRELPRAFLATDVSCSDLVGTIGIVGTPIIDPLTDTMYFYSKTYRGSANGKENGLYRFYAVNILTFQDVAGYPITIDGVKADNEARQYFTGGTHLQRPSLALINNVVYGAFGAHCDHFNYTGWLFGVNVRTNKIVNVFSTATGPFINTEGGFDAEGGGSAIWQGGMGLSTDSSSRMFFVTGNGQGHQNKDTPASGKTPLLTLDETIVNVKIDPATGKISLFDYFQPFDYISLDAADKDLGAAGLALLDPTVFKGQGVSRIGVTGGKNGKAYVVNLDDLGGFKLGAGGTDNCLQSITLDNPTFGGPGSYPLEGGYFYFSPTGSPLAAYKFGTDSNGRPVFSLAGKSSSTIGGRMGPVTVTSFKGQSGTGIAWVCDNSAGLRAFNAVPVNGVLSEITIPPTGGINKFARPAFGDGRVYVATGAGHLIALGSPVNLPLNCTDPINFGTVATGQSKTVTVSCVANIGTKINGATVSENSFRIQNSSFPTAQLKQGDRFTFPVVWDVTTQQTPGVKTAALTIHTTNGVAKYVTSQPLNLRGQVVSSAAYLEVNPGVVDFGGAIVGQESSSGVSVGFTISNSGSSELTISKVSYALTNQVDNSGISYSDVTSNSDGTYNAGRAFKLTALPAVGRKIAAGATLSVTANFKAVDGVGNYASVLKIDSNGGSDKILLSGSASTAPKGRFEIQSTSGSWVKTFDLNFGNVVSGNNVIRAIRLCNDGGSPLVITKSKPPAGSEIFATSTTDDLYEGQNIASGQCGTATIKFQPVPMVPNTDPHSVSETWTLNVNDLTFGLHDVKFQGVALARQLGPLMPDGTARYRYLGCYQDGVNGRLLPKNTNLNDKATVGLCAQTGLDSNYIFAGTQYHKECWQGNTAPPQIYYYPESASKCTWSCTGDVTQPCGGDGKFMNVFYDRTRYTPSGITSRSVAPMDTATSTTRSSSTTSSRSTTRSSTTTSSSSSSSTTSQRSSSTTSARTSTSARSSTTTSRVTTTSRTTTTSQTTTSIITSNPQIPTKAVENPGVGRWNHTGCYADPGTGVKAVNPFKKYTTDSMTVKLCLDHCESLSYVYAGLEYYRECYCGNNFIGTEKSVCANPCMGNSSEICGGPRRMNVYRFMNLLI